VPGGQAEELGVTTMPDYRLAETWVVWSRLPPRICRCEPGSLVGGLAGLRPRAVPAFLPSESP